MNISDIILQVNETLWLLSNALVGYITIMAIIFSITYPILFDPRATSAGKVILAFMFSMVGVMGLMFVGVFIDPAPGRSFFEYPDDLLWWRASARFLTYGYVAYAVTNLVHILWLRKFHPHKVVTAPNGDTLPVMVREWQALRKHKNR